jgi:signal transduction histidine kinase
MFAVEDSSCSLHALRRYSAGQTLRLSSRVAAVGVVGLGLLVIVGWHTGNRTLVQVVPGFVPMQYNTALGFVCCGAALLLLVCARPRWAAVAGGVATLIGGLTLVEYLAHIDLGIDQLLMEHDITVHTSQPGRMAPNTAICFLLTGLCAAIDLLDWRAARRSLAQVVLASLVFGLASVPLSGYFTGLETAYGWGNLTQMAVHTSAGFIVVSVGMMALVWSRGIEGRSRLPSWLPIPIAIAIVTATLCFWQALVAEGLRIERLHKDLSSLPNLAAVMLLVGTLLAVAMALVAYLAQQAAQRARQLDQTNVALQEEVQTRQTTELALEVHRDHLEAMVAARTSELDEARHAAEAANRAKSEFLSHMSHELRTPLNGILGYAQILQRGAQATAGQRDSLQAIVDCGDHLLALINDVLDLSKIEAGRLEVDNAACNLRDLIKSVSAIVAERASRKGVRFQVDVAADLPEGIVTDGAKLRQVLVNLLGNAVKFTAAGQVMLTARESPAGMLQLAVADMGVGMTAAEIKEIFDPFKQVEAGKAAGGTGLGLAISKRLVDALGATLEVESEKGKGSTFSVTLRIVAASVEGSPAMSGPDTAPAGEWTLAAERDSTIMVHPGSDWPVRVPPETLARLRSALRIKNLTAIKALAAELSAASATAPLGEEIAKLAQAFHFDRLSSLLDDLEQDHDAD